MNSPRTRFIISALPGLVGLGLFYSLAIHMHHSLNGWPTSIGERGFPPTLVTHAAVAVNFYCALLLTIFVLPVPIIVCLFVERWQRFVVYLAVYAGSLLVYFVLTQVAAPAQFLYWWRD